MIDPTIVEATKDTVIVGTGLLCSKEILLKIFGPTADFIGEGIRSHTERAAKNVETIIKKTIKKMGEKIEAPGEVPPRVMKGLIMEGPFIEDEIAAEYFGGVLASSKSEIDRDDRGSTYINIISTLSTYQIRTHYILYTLLRKTLFEFRKDIGPGIHRDLMTIYIPTEKYFAYLDINDEFGSEDEKLSILAHSINGMRRLDLVDYLYYGKEDIFQKEKIKYKFPEFPIDEKKLSSHGIAFQPSPGGMELYLWAHGFGQYPHQKFLSEELVFNPIQDIELPDLAILLYENFVKHYLKSQHNKK